MSERTYSQIFYCSGNTSEVATDQEEDALSELVEQGYGVFLVRPSWNNSKPFEFNRLYWDYVEQCRSRSALGGLAIVGARMGTNMALSLFEGLHKESDMAVVTIANLPSNLETPEGSVAYDAQLYAQRVVWRRLRASRVASGTRERMFRLHWGEEIPIEEQRLSQIGFQALSAATAGGAVLEGISLLPQVLTQLAESSTSS